MISGFEEPTSGSILLEGRFDQAVVQRVVALEDDEAFPYATVKSGLHLVQVE